MCVIESHRIDPAGLDGTHYVAQASNVSNPPASVSLLHRHLLPIHLINSYVSCILRSPDPNVALNQLESQHLSLSFFFFDGVGRGLRVAMPRLELSEFLPFPDIVLFSGKG